MHVTCLPYILEVCLLGLTPLLSPFLPPSLHTVGVGFSFSTDPTTDYELGDRQAAKDNYAVILAFFEKFPQYLPNDFVISSESWG